MDFQIKAATDSKCCANLISCPTSVQNQFPSSQSGTSRAQIMRKPALPDFGRLSHALRSIRLSGAISRVEIELDLGKPETLMASRGDS